MLNHVALLGRLAQEPEIKMTTTGKKVARFDLAVPVMGNKEAPPDYIPIICWEKKAEFAELYLGKGRQVVVEGRLKTRKWEDNDGKNRKAMEVIASSVYFADSNNGGAGNGGNNQASSYDDNSQLGGFEPVANDDGDLPF